jgi:hypothetical protein
MKKVIFGFMLCCIGMVNLGSNLKSLHAGSGSDSEEQPGDFLSQQSVLPFTPNFVVEFSSDDEEESGNRGLIASPPATTKCPDCVAKNNQHSVLAVLCGELVTQKDSTHRARQRAKKHKKRSLAFKKKHKGQLLNLGDLQQKLAQEKRMNRLMARRIYDLEMREEKIKASAQHDASIIYALSMKQQRDGEVIGYLNDTVLSVLDRKQELADRCDRRSQLTLRLQQELQDLREKEAERLAKERLKYEQATPGFY